MNNVMTNLMKPLPITATANGLKAERENVLMKFLSAADQSVCVSDALCDIGEFPGCEEPVAFDDNYRYFKAVKRNAIAATFGRLESQGRIISTKFRGKRYYSIPVEN